MTSAPELTVLRTVVSDPRVRPLIRELGAEYTARYGKDAHAELARCTPLFDTAAYHAASTGKTEVVGTYSGAGATLQGLIAATTKKDSGLAEPLADALNEVIDNGTYAQVLKRWGLSDEAVQKSEINPPGLPKNAS